MYSLLRKLLFLLNPEVSHDLSMDMLGATERLGLIGLLKPKLASKPIEVMGLRFENPVGLAAGLDKNGQYLNALGGLGFGFVEIGTVTPVAQSGNPQPRLFRLPEHKAIINRMGFNNQGVDKLVERVKTRRYTGVLGINIGKNKVTPEEDALRDYEICMERVYEVADYIAINISSPNTPGLRNLQFGDALNTLLAGIQVKREQLEKIYGKRVPVAVKISPDSEPGDLKSMAKAFLDTGIDAVIATNTTVSRDGVETSEFADEAGGLSGVPVSSKSTETIKILREALGPDMPIIGVGGIMSAADAQEKLDAGANLVQLYSGFIYEGPELIGDIVASL